MAIRFGNIADWRRAGKGNSIVLPGAKRRKVRLEVSTFIPTNFLMWKDEKMTEAFPLGTVNGHEVFEFYAEGQIVINADANVFYRCADGQETFVRLDEARSFTKPATRRARNYAQEWAEYMMNVNINRRIAAVEADLERKLIRAGIDPKTGEVLDDGKRPAAGAGKTAKRKDRAHDEGEPDAGPGGDGGDEADPKAGDESGERSKSARKQAAPADG